MDKDPSESEARYRDAVRTNQIIHQYPSRFQAEIQAVPFQEARLQQLIKFLPISMQRSHMTGKKVNKSPSRVYVNVSFKGLPGMRKRRLSRLKEMSVEYKETADESEKEGRQELRSRCEEADIELESSK